MFNEIFKDLKDEVGGAVRDMRYGSTRTIHIAKPYCSPCRNIITAALQPYGVKVHEIREQVHKVSLMDFARRMKVELRNWENLKYGGASVIWLLAAWHAQVTVNDQAAAWVEYLLIRTGKLYVPGQYVDPRNEAWANKHGGKMPPAWKDGKSPWIETNCSDGMGLWQQVKEATQPNKKGKGKK